MTKFNQQLMWHDTLEKTKHWAKDAIHLYTCIWDFLPKQYNIPICKIKTETIIRQPPKTL